MATWWGRLLTARLYAIGRQLMAQFQIKARSLKSQSDPEFPNAGSAAATGQKNLLLKPGMVVGSRFELRSFSGKIHLKRP